MAQKKNTTNLTELLLQCMAQTDPMLSMLEWLCEELMEAEVTALVGAEKNQHNAERTSYRCGYRPRRLDTRMGTMYLMVPKVRNGGYIHFVTERKRSEAALIHVVQEANVQGVSTRKMEKLAQSLGIEGLSRRQVSEMTKGLNEQVQAFRNRSLADIRYPVLWVDALCEKVRMDGWVISMAVVWRRRGRPSGGFGRGSHAGRVQRELFSALLTTEKARAFSAYPGNFRCPRWAGVRHSCWLPQGLSAAM